ncbi:hypothetical protein [Anaeromyxobacter terrae]|uniref:hypothetical protein n=1 Tax=Anaeromyxobacter terrae TaxID=2925406 RepID=UPI001F55B8F0|nr:hypothetical protein [Anaeromyxobacter sp. SG22]
MRTGWSGTWILAVAGLAVGAACGDAREVANDENTNTPATPTPTAQVSFEQELHPLLQGKCGACHGNDWGSPDVNTSYQAALGKVDTANPAQSPLYVRPTGGSGHAKVLSDSEALLVLQWIQQGAKGPTAATTPTTPTTPATPAAVSFSQQIHPFLRSDCGGCHGDAWGSSDLVTSYAAALQKVDTANPAQSLLYLRPTGTGHAKILSDANAQLLLQWIREGAKND